MNKKEKMKQLKNKNGITLIALVVTIIVLIILAAVSINLVLGENGIITKARDAARQTEEAKLNEEVATNELMEQWEGLVGGGSTPTNPEGPTEPEEYASYNTPYIPTGFIHTEGTWNSGYTIKETATGNEFVWVPCVTDESKIKPGDNVEIFKKTLPSTTETTDSYYKYNIKSLRLAPTDTSITDAEPTEAIRTSVGTYGGFYIAKYEAGVPLDEEGNEIAATSATTSQKARSVSGANTWTSITRANAIKAAENMIDSSSGVKSGLISGECWDTTLQWMVNTSDNASNEPNAGYDVDSTGNGWYGQSNITTTGKYPINNIYDMAGNVWEWSTENFKMPNSETTGSTLTRGGMNYVAAPAADRLYNDSLNTIIGFRVVLYK